MDIVVGRGAVLVHLGPGEDLHDAVHTAYANSGGAFPVVASCIGSLSYVEFGLAACIDGIPGPGDRFMREDDAIEIGGIQGHVGVDDDGLPSAHLHGVMFGPDGVVFGGHIFKAIVLITIEFALLGRDGPRWRRVHRPVRGSPPLPLLVPEAFAEGS